LALAPPELSKPEKLDDLLRSEEAKDSEGLRGERGGIFIMEVLLGDYQLDPLHLGTVIAMHTMFGLAIMP
jgi:hypothetical protein